jgi:pyrimidine deaminase RibD-like protein
VDDERAHALFEEYAAAVAYVAVETADGDEHMGSAFHAGENIWITARHVVEGNKILEIGTTEHSTANHAEKMAVKTATAPLPSGS